MSEKIEKTKQEYKEQCNRCRTLFERKLHDYDAAWRVLRSSSLTDQLFIKALRIRQLETLGVACIGDNIEDELIGIINYGIIGLIQIQLGPSDTVDIENATALELYDKKLGETYDLMLLKNHDYGEAWRKIRLTSFTDLILSKIYRVKQIENLKGKTQVSEGIPANYQDIVNYAIFALIRMHEEDN